MVQGPTKDTRETPMRLIELSIHGDMVAYNCALLSLAIRYLSIHVRNYLTLVTSGHILNFDAV
jgi:hypothetical protein